MATATYGQIPNLLAILSAWWVIPGLPMSFQRQLLTMKRQVEAEAETMEELRQRLLQEHGVKDEDGKLLVDDQNPQKPVYKLKDQAAFDAAYAELKEATFACPVLSLELVEKHADKLQLTAAVLDVLIPPTGDALVK